MRIVFMGSAELACPSLDALLLAPEHEVLGIVTQPARPKGRRLHMGSCPAKTRAEERGITVWTPANANAPDFLDRMDEAAPELIAVVAYGQILRRRLLEIPAAGCVNVHASLLPRYRGAAPIQWAIANGETVTGVTTMFMNERMDDGDIILQQEVEIGPADTAGAVHDRLAACGAGLLVETLRRIESGNAPRTPQERTMATFAPKLTKADGRLDWTVPATSIYNRVRGFDPWPGCFCLAPARWSRRDAHVGRNGETVSLRVKRCAVTDGAGAPGEIIARAPDGPVVAAGEGAVQLLEVQPEGGRPMAGGAYLCGHDVEEGDRLE